MLSATSICVANMVGTGVFTSLGFQVADITTGFALLALWTVGGLFALCGALSYGELAAALPRSGGEFHFLSRTIHPAAGFLAGWISVFAGFALPIALAAMTFGEYFSRVVPGASPVWLSCALVAVVTLFHLYNLRLGSSFQNIFTALKLGLIVAFIGMPFMTDKRSGLSFAPQGEDLDMVLNPAFGVSLLFVMYAYTGWNAATYIVGEVRDPTKNVPRALFLATSLVMLLYVAIHWAFLTTTPIDDLRGQLEVGHIVATHIFGEVGGKWMSALLCVALVSSVSAMTWAGPRVTQAMGEDLRPLRALAHTSRTGIPVRAILLQTAIIVLMLLTATFKSMLVYVQLILTLSSALTVLGLFVLRHREPDLERPYRTWGYPVTPLLFLTISVVAMIYTAWNQPMESLAGLVSVLLGLLVYTLFSRQATA